MLKIVKISRIWEFVVAWTKFITGAKQFMLNRMTYKTYSTIAKVFI